MTTFYIDNANITVMHYLIYYNSTHSRLDDTWIFYTILTYFELICILISYPPVIFLGIQLFKHRAFHTNLQNCVRAAVLEYLVQLTSRSTQIFLIFYGLENSLVFYYSSIIRCTCYFFVSFTLPAFVIERCCASYFLSDYEKKNRFYISISLLLLMAISGFILSYLYHQAESTLLYHIFMLVINLISSIVIVIIEKYNYRRLYESSNLRKSKREYALAERFQISENIRVCELMKTIINIVSIFNFLSTVSAAIDNFDFSITQLNIASTFFNFCILIYGSLVFFLLYYQIPQFSTAFKDLVTKLRLVNPVGPVTDLNKEKPLKLAAFETDKYFDQLKEQWL